MNISKILLSLPLLSSIIAQTPAVRPTDSISERPSSYSSSVRKMGHLLATAPRLQNDDYIHPSLANHIDALMPSGSSDEIVGIYGNILYPVDQERDQVKKLLDWLENVHEPFPLSSEDFNEISIHWTLSPFPARALSRYFYQKVEDHSLHNSLEIALEKAKQDTFKRADLYRGMRQKIPATNEHAKILIEKFEESASQAEGIIQAGTDKFRKNSAQAFQDLAKWKSYDKVPTPFDWETRIKVFKQMVDKVISLSPNSPYFFALQEVTPQALSDFQKALKNRNLQWISFNNISGKPTLNPRESEVLGEAAEFTSTIALSSDFEILKVELGDLPTESTSTRKILGVRARNKHTDKIYDLFSTHTDHLVRNDIYARSAAKVHEFVTKFSQDSLEPQAFVLGGDLNVFEQLGGGKYVSDLRERFSGCQDYRETDFYAPNPIAWSTFIGRPGDEFASKIAKDGRMEPNALDHILLGSGIELKASTREAGVYNESGKLLDYYKEKEEYIDSLQKRFTFSDHFINVVRFK